MKTRKLLNIVKSSIKHTEILVRKNAKMQTTVYHCVPFYKPITRMLNKKSLTVFYNR